MSRVCPNLECENGELYEGSEQEDIITCPDCGTMLEPFDTDIDDEEEPEEDEEDWQSKYDDSVD